MKCARCGRKLTAETSVYSPFRKVRYCAPPWDRCDRLAKKRQEQAERKAAA